MLRTMTPPPGIQKSCYVLALIQHWGGTESLLQKGLAENGTTNFLFSEKRRSSRVYLLIKWFSRLGFHT